MKINISLKSVTEWVLQCVQYREDFNELDAFMALHFTASRASPAAKRMQILPMTQHADKI
jgi:hypothetical protein